MPKDLSAEVLQAISETVKYPIVLMEGFFEDGVLRLWSGTGNLSWSDETWIGSGDLGKITQIPDHMGVESQSMQVQLLGISLENISLVLNNVKSRNPVNIYLGFMTEDGQLIGDPYPAFGGMADAPSITEDGEKVDIVINLESRSKRVLQKKERRRTHEDQQIDYPGDRGLEYIASLQDAQIKWK